MSVVIETTLGDITVDLFTKERPNTCLNFLKLCRIKYYNLCLFHKVESNFMAQTGDPTGTGRGGESVFCHLYGEQAKYFDAEKKPRLGHQKLGTLSMVNNGQDMNGSQFFITLADNLNYLDELHTVFGQVVEGLDVVQKLNEAICNPEDNNRPYQDIRITHTVVLHDPYDDPPALNIPDSSPVPTKEMLETDYLAPDEEIDENQGKDATEIEEKIKDSEAKARATILEMVGDLPDADVKPPENVLFVCKLNPVTTSEDLEIIFSRFGPIVSCEVIKDRVSGESLGYAFIEFEEEQHCENAYFKMDNVLIDDRRVHVDFSQSVSKMQWDQRTRVARPANWAMKDRKVNPNAEKYQMVFDVPDDSNNPRRQSKKSVDRRSHSRSPSGRDSKNRKPADKFEQHGNRGFYKDRPENFEARRNRRDDSRQDRRYADDDRRDESRRNRPNDSRQERRYADHDRRDESKRNRPDDSHQVRRYTDDYRRDESRRNRPDDSRQERRYAADDRREESRRNRLNDSRQMSRYEDRRNRLEDSRKYYDERRPSPRHEDLRNFPKKLNDSRREILPKTAERSKKHPKPCRDISSSSESSDEQPIKKKKQHSSSSSSDSSSSEQPVNKKQRMDSSSSDSSSVDEMMVKKEIGKRKDSFRQDKIWHDDRRGDKNRKYADDSYLRQGRGDSRNFPSSKVERRNVPTSDERQKKKHLSRGGSLSSDSSSSDETEKLAKVVRRKPKKNEKISADEQTRKSSKTVKKSKKNDSDSSSSDETTKKSSKSKHKKLRKKVSDSDSDSSDESPKKLSKSKHKKLKKKVSDSDSSSSDQSDEKLSKSKHKKLKKKVPDSDVSHKKLSKSDGRKHMMKVGSRSPDPIKTIKKHDREHSISLSKSSSKHSLKVAHHLEDSGSKSSKKKHKRSPSSSPEPSYRNKSQLLQLKSKSRKQSESESSDSSADDRQHDSNKRKHGDIGVLLDDRGQKKSKTHKSNHRDNAEPPKKHKSIRYRGESEDRDNKLPKDYLQLISHRDDVRDRDEKASKVLKFIRCLRESEDRDEKIPKDYLQTISHRDDFENRDEKLSKHKSSHRSKIHDMSSEVIPRGKKHKHKEHKKRKRSSS